VSKHPILSLRTTVNLHKQTDDPSCICRSFPLLFRPLTAITCVMEVSSTLTCRYTEAEAAKDAGVYALLVDRPGNAPLAEQDRERFPVIQQLTELP
jgi:hypothetical protein